MNYHVSRHGESLGEFSVEQITAMVGAGQLTAADAGWVEGMAEWQPLGVLIPGLGSVRVGGVVNPYAAPVARQVAVAGGEVDVRTVGLLRGTRGWVMLMAVVGAIGSAMMVLGALAMLLMGEVMASSMGGAMGGGSGMPGVPPRTMMMGMAGLYLVMAGLYVYPIMKLFQFCGAVESLSRTRAQRDLERALNAQRVFWKFIGIMMLAGIVIYVIAIAALVGTGVMAGAAKARSGPVVPPSTYTPP
jgi:hypothetical protein